MVREMAKQLVDGVRMLHETRKLCHTVSSLFTESLLVDAATAHAGQGLSAL